MTKYEHGRNRKVRHAPLVHEKNLAMGREERPAGSGEDIGRARAEESGDRYNGHDHLNEEIAKLE